MALSVLWQPARRWGANLRVNWRHPLSHRLARVWLANGGMGSVRDLAYGAVMSPLSTSRGFAFAPYGPLVTKSGGSYDPTHSRSPLSEAAATSASAFFVLHDVAAGAALAGDNTPANNGFYVDGSSIMRLRVSSGNRIDANTYTVPTSGEVRLGFSSTSGNYRTFNEGRLDGTGTSSFGSFKAVHELGGYSGAAEAGGAKWHLCYSWLDRYLNDAEHEALARNPYCLLEEPVYWFTADAGGTPQYARPSADISDGSWLCSSGSDLYAMLDETPYSDSDYIYTNDPSAVGIVELGDVSDPGVGTGHIVRYRAHSPYSQSVKVGLYEGTTLIAEWTDALGTTAAEYTHTLSSGEANSITDYTALRLRFTGVTPS